MRLDNVVYRLGFADSRRQARQIVRHGHIGVNGHRVDIPSYQVKSADVIAWRESSVATEYYKRLAQQIGDKIIPEWLSLDQEKLSGKVMAPPKRSDIDLSINEKVIVEYYSR
jgi:small subunit ribosomal protein S4